MHDDAVGPVHTILFDFVSGAGSFLRPDMKSVWGEYETAVYNSLSKDVKKEDVVVVPPSVRETMLPVTRIIGLPPGTTDPPPTCAASAQYVPLVVITWAIEVKQNRSEASDLPK